LRIRPSLFTRIFEYFIECSTKFDVEDGVNNRIEEAVHVPGPDEEREEDGINLTYSCVLKKVVSYADGVDDRYGEERDPAQEEHP